MPRIRALLALVATLLLSTPTAWACDCAPITLEESARQADVVAHVRIEREEHAQLDGRVFYTVTPLTLWKGSFDSAFMVSTATDAAECGLPDHGARDELLLFARDTGEQGTRQYVTDVCSGTTTWSQAVGDDLAAAIGPGRAPSLDPRVPTGEIKVDGIQRDGTQAILVVTVLVGLLGILIGMMMGRHMKRRRSR